MFKLRMSLVEGLSGCVPQLQAGCNIRNLTDIKAIKHRLDGLKGCDRLLANGNATDKTVGQATAGMQFILLQASLKLNAQHTVRPQKCYCLQDRLSTEQTISRKS